ncbi:MAG: molybdopterin-dependent oxidoreductase [Dehalococcoidia bacterium]|nr:molybdopterin-dependent oxidoreductase [Dehalococcoidia bacterium]
MTTFKTIGKSEPRRDLPEKLTGEAKYAADVQLPGMLFGKILRSPYPHARILSINVDAARSLPGVRAAVTPFDAPKGQVAPDMPILDTEVRYVGDEVAAVAADDEDLAEAALGLIEVNYEQLPFVTDAVEAIKPDAPQTRPEGNLVGGKPLTLTRGSVEEGFAQADRIFEETYSTPAHAGAALEPRAAVASWDGDNLTVWKSTRGVHADQLALSLALDVPRGNIRVMGQNMGAGYGTKDETRLGAITAVLAQRAGRPVKIELTRQEEFVAGRHRHGTTTTVRMGVKNDGTVTVVHATTIMDTGAYLSSGPGVIRRAGQGALYLYRCANVQYDGYLTYTNTPSGGSYRALGAPQGHFALESLADTISEALGIDPLEFRLKNHVGLEGQPGERVTPANEILDTQPVEGGVPFSSNGLRECLQIGSEAIDWGQPSEQPESGNLRRGKGMGMFIYRGGAGGRSIARMRLESDGSLRLLTGLMDVGEGSLTVMPQIAAEELGVGYDQVLVTFGDSETTPEAPLTAGSTATFSTGTATKEAARQLKARMIEVVAPLLDTEPSNLQITDDGVEHIQYPERSVSFAQIAESAGEIEVEAAISPGSRDHVINSFGAHFAEVEVDTDTGQVRVLRYIAAHDSGRILNPKLAINQVEGGVSQMLGFTLSEQMLTDPRNGVTLNASFLEHKSPTLQDFPEIQVLFVDVVDPVGPFGAKALGEPPSIGVAPAVTNAIYNAIGVRIRDLPLTPDRVLNEIEAQRGDSQ